jgi:hypothetical protein
MQFQFAMESRGAAREPVSSTAAKPTGLRAAIIEHLEPRQLLAVAPYEGLPAAMKSDAGFTPLFNGQNLSGFYTFIQGKGINNDPQGYFRAENGMLHVMGMPKTSKTMPYGYIATQASYANYRLRFEYKWGTNRFAPRATLPRDSGLLLGFTGSDKIWPASYEVQIKERNTGDLWMLPNSGPAVSINTTVESTSVSVKKYKAGGVAYRQTGGRIARSATLDRLTDWNTVDVIVEGANAIVMVNGTVVNRVTNIRTPSGAALTSGKIALQAEGAEVWYRNIKIKPLRSTPAPANAIRLFDSSSSTAAFERRNGGGPIGWTAVNGELTVKPGTGDIKSKQTSAGNFRLHAEFNLNVKADATAEQDKANSGVGVAGSYELQVLDSYKRTLADRNDLGAIYGIKNADINAALPAGAWQSYDITYTAPVWQNGQKISNARMTVYLNGFLIHNNVTVPTSTFTFLAESPTGGPLLVLQDHGNAVRYRNIWVVKT